MADITLDVQTEPSTPSAGSIVTWFDTGRQRLASKNSSGNVTYYAPENAIIPGIPQIGMDEVSDPNDAMIVSPSQRMNRDNLMPNAKDWSFLGTATGATVTVGPVVWTGIFQQIMIVYFMAGHSAGTPVGRVLIGGASISTTGLTNGNACSENFAAPTAANSIPGMPTAVTLTNIGRAGEVFIDGASGSLKTYNCVGRNGTPAVAASPTIYQAAGAFSDLGSNLPIQRAQLTVYDTLTATAVSANTFTAGTYLSVWGRNND